MKNPFLVLPLCALSFILVIQPSSHAAAASPAGPLIKHLSSLVKLTKSTQLDGNVLQFENGYLVETVVEGNALGVVPYSIRVSQDGELFAVDSESSNIVRITPPLSQYSRARLVAGSFEGKTGHIDGKPSDARFDHPKGVTVDDKGNVYVADTVNLAIRKIGEAGVTTIAGGKSSVPGYSDGPGEDAKFSSDFDVVYIHRTCSLLVVDRGNAALRQISLNHEDCDSHSSSITGPDIFMVIGAILVGYATCVLQQGLGPSLFTKILPASSANRPEPEKMVHTPIVEQVKEEQIAGWPSFSQLIVDLSKLALEGMGSIFLYLIPSCVRRAGSRKNLTPLKDSLKMPEDESEAHSAKKLKGPAPCFEVGLLRPPIAADKYMAMKTGELRSTSLKDPSVSDKHTAMKATDIRSTSLKDPSMPSKHRSKRQDYTEFYGSSEIPSYSNQVRLKSQKERTKHRHREKSGEVAPGPLRPEANPIDPKAGNRDEPKFDPYTFRAKYGSDDLYRY
ncbi:hypothetical protein Droror1_Dr00027299 [Drosera rotundifolia]